MYQELFETQYQLFVLEVPHLNKILRRSQHSALRSILTTHHKLCRGTKVLTGMMLIGFGSTMFTVTRSCRKDFTTYQCDTYYDRIVRVQSSKRPF